MAAHVGEAMGRDSLALLAFANDLLTMLQLQLSRLNSTQQVEVVQVCHMHKNQCKTHATCSHVDKNNIHNRNDTSPLRPSIFPCLHAARPTGR